MRTENRKEAGNVEDRVRSREEVHDSNTVLVSLGSAANDGAFHSSCRGGVKGSLRLQPCNLGRGPGYEQ